MIDEVGIVIAPSLILMFRLVKQYVAATVTSISILINVS